MWKVSSSRSGGDSARSSSRGKRDGQQDKSVGRQRGKDSPINDGQPLQERTSTVKISDCGIGFQTTREDKQGFLKLNKQDGRPGSSTNCKSRPSLASQSVHLFKVFKRKVLLPSGSSKTSSSEQSPVHNHAGGVGVRNGKTQDEDFYSTRQETPSVNRLEEELQNLRQRLNREQAEMLKLRNEVTWLRLTSATSSPQPQTHIHAVTQLDNDGFVSRSDSIRSDGSQLSCLDFSLASTGMLKFEGELKARITPVSPSQFVRGDQMDSFLSDATAVSQLLSGNFAKVNKVVESEEEQSAGNINSSSVMKDKHVGATAKSFDRSFPKEETSEPEYVEKYCHDYTGADLKVVNTGRKTTNLNILIPGHIHEPEEKFEFYYCNPESQATDNCWNPSRSPPNSVSSTEEPDMTVFGPSREQKIYLDSDDSSVLQKAAPVKVTGDSSEAASPKCSVDHADLGLVKKFRVMDMQTYHELALERFTASNQTKDSRSEALTNSTARGFNREEFTIFTPSVEPKNYSSPALEEAPLNVTSDNSISGSLEKTEPAQLTRLQLNLTAIKISPVSPSAKSENPLTIQTRSTASSSKLNMSPASHSLGTEEALLKATVPNVASDNNIRLPSSKFSGLSSQEKAPGPLKVSSKISQIVTGTRASSPPKSPFSRNATLDFSSSWTEDPPKVEMRYPELELDKLWKTMKSLRGEKNSTSSNACDPRSDLVSRATSLSPSKPAELIQAPLRSLELQSQAPRRSLDLQLEVPRRSLDLQLQLPPWSADAQSQKSTARHGRLLQSASFTFPRARGTSPSINSVTSGAKSRQLNTLHSKSKYDRGNSIRQTISSDLMRDSSSEKLDLEEEVRQCLEQSRQLLNDATAKSTYSDDDHNSPLSSQSSRESSFSVLALSRRRRSAEISKPLATKTQKEHAEHQAIAPYEDKPLNVQSSTANRVHAKEEDSESVEFSASIILPRGSHETMESGDKKSTVELEARDSKLRNLCLRLPSSTRTRSRFYLEANAAGFSSLFSTDMSS